MAYDTAIMRKDGENMWVEGSVMGFDIPVEGR